MTPITLQPSLTTLSSPQHTLLTYLHPALVLIPQSTLPPAAGPLAHCSPARPPRIMPDASLERTSSFASSYTMAATRAPLPSRTFVARSTAFQLALERLRRLARTRLPVLLEGETGTGKTYFA